MSSPLTILPLDHDPVWPPQVCGGCGARGATRDVSVRLLRVGEQSMAAMSFFRKQRRIAVPACAACEEALKRAERLRPIESIFPFAGVAMVVLSLQWGTQTRLSTVQLVLVTIPCFVLVAVALPVAISRRIGWRPMLTMWIDGDTIRYMHTTEEHAKRFAEANALARGDNEATKQE